MIARTEYNVNSDGYIHVQSYDEEYELITFADTIYIIDELLECIEYQREHLQSLGYEQVSFNEVIVD